MNWWKYRRKVKQDEAEGKSRGCYRRTYIVSRHDGMFRLSILNWRTKPTKILYTHTVGDMGNLRSAKQVAEIMESCHFMPYRGDIVNIGAIKRHLDAAILELES